MSWFRVFQHPLIGFILGEMLLSLGYSAPTLFFYISFLNLVLKRQTETVNGTSIS